MHVPYDSAISLLGIHPSKMKTGLLKNLYAKVYDSFTYNYPNWKQPKGPSTGKWINKCGTIHTMEYYSAVKWNGKR